MVNIGTEVENVKGKKTSTVRTTKTMDTSFKNVTAGRSMDRYARNVTIRVTKKRSARINKKRTKKKKR